MIKIDIHEAKTHLSRYLDRVEKGETIIVCRRDVPIAEIRALQSERRSERPIGLAKGKFEIPKNFFLPLPEDIISSFYSDIQ